MGCNTSSEAKPTKEEAKSEANHKEPEVGKDSKCPASEEEAATKIQAVFRGHKTRKSMSMKASGQGAPAQKKPEPEPTRAELEAEFRADDKELCSAATKIQASFRGHQSRKQVEVDTKEAMDKDKVFIQGQYDRPASVLFDNIDGGKNYNQGYRLPRAPHELQNYIPGYRLQRAPYEPQDPYVQRAQHEPQDPYVPYRLPRAQHEPQHPYLQGNRYERPQELPQHPYLQGHPFQRTPELPQHPYLQGHPFQRTPELPQDPYLQAYRFQRTPNLQQDPYLQAYRFQRTQNLPQNYGQTPIVAYYRKNQPKAKRISRSNKRRGQRSAKRRRSLKDFEDLLNYRNKAVDPTVNSETDSNDSSDTDDNDSSNEPGRQNVIDANGYNNKKIWDIVEDKLIAAETLNEDQKLRQKNNRILRDFFEYLYNVIKENNAFRNKNTGSQPSRVAKPNTQKFPTDKVVAAANTKVQPGGGGDSTEYTDFNYEEDNLPPNGIGHNCNAMPLTGTSNALDVASGSNNQQDLDEMLKILLYWAAFSKRYDTSENWGQVDVNSPLEWEAGADADSQETKEHEWRWAYTNLRNSGVPPMPAAAMAPNAEKALRNMIRAASHRANAPRYSQHQRRRRT